MSQLLKNLLIALGLVLIIAVGYMVFVRGGTSGSPSVIVSETIAIETQQILATYNELENFDIEGRIFSDPLFLSLVDFRVDPGSEPSGRTNPFAPVQQ